MRLLLAVKTLFRSLPKTLLTFAILAASAFIFMHSLTEYALTAREYERAVSSYRGVLCVEYGTPERPDIENKIDSPIFLLSDPKSPVAFDEFYVYEEFHHPGLSNCDIEAVSSLAYITSTSVRYMGAGISPEYYRLDNMSYYNYTARVVFEATLEDIDRDPQYPSGMSDWQMEQSAYDLYIKNIQMLAGNPDWLSITDTQTDKDRSRIRLNVYNPEFLQGRNERNFHYLVGFCRIWAGGQNRYTAFYWQNNIGAEQLEHLIPGERYIFVGRVEPSPSWDYDYYHFMLGDDTLFNWWPYITPLEGMPENYLETDEFAQLHRLIQITKDDLHTFDIVYTEDMDTIRRVRDERILPTRGRFLTAQDSKRENRVCVVSEEFMSEYGLSLGDTVELRLGNRLFEQYLPLGAVASLKERYADRFVDAEFEIVGAFTDINMQKMRSVDLYRAYSDNTIFVPMCFLPAEPDESHEFKPGEISFVVGDARNIRPFAQECIPKLEEMGLTVYFSDGGWMRVEEQVAQAGSLSLSKLLAFSAACVLAAALTVYLFIGRKKREYAIMRALGTTKGLANRALFVPLVLLAVCAIISGGVGALIYIGKTAVNSLREFTEMGLNVDTSIPAPVVVFGVLGQLATVMIITGYGLRLLGKKPPLLLLSEKTNRNVKQRKSKQMTENDTSEPPRVFAVPPPEEARMPETGKQSAARHIFRCIVRSSRRAAAKSLLSILLAALLAGAMGQFTAVRKAYSNLYHNIQVKARFINGMPYSGALKVADSGYVQSINNNLTNNEALPYYEYILKSGEVGFEHSEIYMTSDITRAAGDRIELLDGYDRDTVMTLKEKICVLSDRLMEALDVEPGDMVVLNELDYLETLRFNHPEYPEEKLLEDYNRHGVKCKVVGRIFSDAIGAAAFVPVAAELYFKSIIYPLNLDLAEYTLSDYHKAGEFREYAGDIVDSVRKIPPMFLMDTSEADNIYKIYRLIETLYPIGAVAALLIGGIIPGLIILQTAREASIMRVLGTTKRRTRLILILGQLMLCLLGLIFALGIIRAINAGTISEISSPLLLYWCLHIAACIAGSSAGSVIVTRRRILELLQVKE